MAPQDVKASLNYALDEGRAHFRFGYDEEGQERSGGNVVAKEVLVNDGRGADIKFKTHGFELVDFPTTFEKEDFYGDRSKILADYYREMEECIKRHTGAEIVKCFNYIVRNPVKFDPDADNHFVKDYANGIHTDTGPEGARALFSCLSEDLDERFQRGRFVYINAWRNISDDPIEDYNLAILDPNSLKGSEDFIDNEYYGYDPEHDFKFKEKTFVLNQRNNADHRWFYFPRMTKNEVLIFKQWDSDPSAPTRTCFHTSFSRADGADAAVPPLRESIDVRALAFFPGSESSLDLHEEEKESEKRENPKFLTEGRTEDFLAYRCGSFTVAGGNLGKQNEKLLAKDFLGNVQCPDRRDDLLAYRCGGLNSGEKNPGKQNEKLLAKDFLGNVQCPDRRDDLLAYRCGSFLVCDINPGKNQSRQAKSGAPW